MIREDRIDRSEPELTLAYLGEHIAIIVWSREVAADQGLWSQPRPGSVHTSTSDAASEQEHDISVAVISAAAAVLGYAAAELDITATVTLASRLPMSVVKAARVAAN